MRLLPSSTISSQLPVSLEDIYLYSHAAIEGVTTLLHGSRAERSELRNVLESDERAEKARFLESNDENFKTDGSSTPVARGE